ncbi:lysophospholipase catalytic domain-containing protein [Scleroderma yunnanense]
MTAISSALVLTLLCLLGSVQGDPFTSYAPTAGSSCPNSTSANSSSLIRTFTPQTQSLDSQEQAYISARESNVIPGAWSEWLGDGSSIGYNLPSFQGHFPRVGIAIGGASLRTAQFGAGVLSALDARNDTAKSIGTGGLLQVASYLASSSGGAWLAGSMVANDWPSLSDLVYGNGKNLSGWMLDLDLVAPSSIDVNDNGNQQYWGSILSSVQAKASTPMDTSMTDIWGRMVSYHFLSGTTPSNFFTNQTGHGAGELWSQVPLLPSYQAHSIPFPIIVADSVVSNETNTSSVSPNSVVYEITPQEFGSWDPQLSAMTSTTYAGTQFVNGRPTNSSSCVTGFDQVGFVMGTSASAFNGILDVSSGNFVGFNTENGDASGMQFLYQQLSSRVQTRSQTVANWPNPFNGLNPPSFQDSNSQWLSLVDGGSNLEQVPFGSLLVKARGIDVVVAVDASADDPNLWPNGTSLLSTSQRISSVLSSSHQGFPPIPSSAQSFISTGVNQRPTFFGCNPSQNPAEYPLVIYLPNSPPLDGSPPATNTGDMQLSYTLVFTEVFVNQAFANTFGGFLPNTTSPDPNWGKCLQCAAIDRARLKLSPTVSRSSMCSQCFAQYCYDPSNPPSVSEVPGRNYVFSNPDPGGVTKVKKFLSSNKGTIIGSVVAVVCVVAGAIAFIFWWRRRRERKNRYSRVHDLRDDDEPWKYYDSYSGEYELPAHRMSIN